MKRQKKSENRIRREGLGLRLCLAMSEAEELRREIELLKRVLASLDDADKSAQVVAAAAAGTTGEAVDLAAELK